MIERERKFLVDGSKFPLDLFAKSYKIRMGYFTENGVAIRVTSAQFINGDYKSSKVCFKSPGGEERHEFEYYIPKEDAEQLLELSPTKISKLRLEYEGWEVDMVLLEDKSLYMAEWEEHEGQQAFPSKLPEWIQKEVTGDHHYSMQYLAWEHGEKK